MKGMDRLSTEQRSWNMSRIRAKSTKPELIVRSILHRLGFRFRINRKDLPGKPDIVLPKYKTVIFVHGCYWHRHKGCKKATTPKKNHDFWVNKFNENITRDQRNQAELEQLGWGVIILWECKIESDPILAVLGSLIDKGILEKNTPYPAWSPSEIKCLAEKKFESSWQK